MMPWIFWSRAAGSAPSRSIRLRTDCENTFRAMANGPDASVTVLTKKPVIASDDERNHNPRSHGAARSIAVSWSGLAQGLCHESRRICRGHVAGPAFVWERVDIVCIGYHIERLKAQKVPFERERDELQVKLSGLTVPERIARLASDKLE